MPKPRHLYDVRQYTVLMNKEQKFLALQLPAHYGEFAHKWTLPGGKLEPKDSPIKGIKREIAEETSLKVKGITPYHLDRWESKNSRKLGVFYLSYLTGFRKKPKLSEEHQAFAWVDIKEIKQYDFYRKEFVKAIQKAYAL